VQATRAYLAGLGTAGSIVVGASLVFVLASAVVAFRGWPDATAAGAPAQVVLSVPARAQTPVARRLVALGTRRPSGSRVSKSAAALHRRPARGAGSAARGAGSSVGTLGGPSGTRGAAPGTQPVTVLTTTTPTATTTTPPTTGTSGGTEGPVGTSVNKVTGTVGETVSGAGTGVATVVTKVTTVVTQVTAPVPGALSKVGSNLP
jgi:hypothetical protein